MGERRDYGMSKKDIEAVNQMLLARRRLNGIIPLIRPHFHLSEDSLFTLGNETEPYTEAVINTMIAQEWGISSKRRRNITKNTSI